VIFIRLFWDNTSSSSFYWTKTLDSGKELLTMNTRWIYSCIRLHAPEKYSITHLWLNWKSFFSTIRKLIPPRHRAKISLSTWEHGFTTFFNIWTVSSKYKKCTPISTSYTYSWLYTIEVNNDWHEVILTGTSTLLLYAHPHS